MYKLAVRSLILATCIYVAGQCMQEIEQSQSQAHVNVHVHVHAHVLVHALGLDAMFTR